MRDLDCMFFLSGSSTVNTRMAESAFSYGLYDKTNNIFSTMMYVDATDDDIEEKAANYGFDMVYIVRIPKMFLMPTLNADRKLIDAPLPIWKKVDGNYYLSNELVYGIYYRRTKTFDYNDNYKEIHNPAGLLFDRKQDGYFKENNLDMWSKFSDNRKTMTYDKLLDYDLAKKTWDKFIQRYERHYNNTEIKK